MLEDERKKLEDEIDKTRVNISKIELISEDDLSTIKERRTYKYSYIIP